MVMVLKLSAPRAPAKPPATSFPPVQNRKQALSDRDRPPREPLPGGDPKSRWPTLPFGATELPPDHVSQKDAHRLIFQGFTPRWFKKMSIHAQR